MINWSVLTQAVIIASLVGTGLALLSLGLSTHMINKVNQQVDGGYNIGDSQFQNGSWDNDVINNNHILLQGKCLDEGVKNIIKAKILQ